MKTNEIRDLIITGNFLIGEDGLREPACGWKDYANKLEETLVKNNGTLKPLPTEQDCMLAGHERKNKLPIEYDKVSYELGFHQAYNWMLSQIYKGNVLSHVVNEHSTES